MGCNESSLDNFNESESQKEKQGSKISSTIILNSNKISFVQDEFQDSDTQIFLFGTSDCGKTTLLKQIKLICNAILDQESFSTNPDDTFEEKIVREFQYLIELTHNNGMKLSDNLQTTADEIFNLEFSFEDVLTPELAAKISSIWHDPLIQTAYETIKSIDIFDTASYFFDKITEIAKNGYKLSNEDILRIYLPTLSINNLSLLINDDIKATFYDFGGDEGSRFYWHPNRIRPASDFVIFFISLSDFNQRSYENDNLLRTKDSMNMFRTYVNKPMVKKVPIFLVFTKSDIFREKLKKYGESFRQMYQEDSIDTNDTGSCIELVKSRYLQLIENRNEREIESFEICTLNNENVRNICQDIIEKIIHIQEKKKNIKNKPLRKKKKYKIILMRGNSRPKL